MHPSLFYPLNTMTVSQWFNMLASSEQQEEFPAYIYEVIASSKFEINNQQQESGTYYMRATKDDVNNNLNDLKGVAKVRKLPFSEIVYLSDCFSTIIPKIIPSGDAIKELVEQSETASYLEQNIASTAGLERMKNKVQEKYFDGWMGVFRKFFSAIANFFRKYDSYLETGIYWPGSSISYANKVIDQINRLKKVYLNKVIPLSREKLIQRLDIKKEEAENLSFEDIKKIYKKKIILLHPDKNFNLPKEEIDQKFQQVNKVFGDYAELMKVCKAMGFKDLEEVLKNEKKPSSAGSPLSFRVEPILLALPAPGAVVE